MSRPRLLAVLLVFCSLLLPTAVGAAGKPAGGGSKTLTGYDVSYPQCGGPLPANVLFGIVGVNDGIVYSANPCLAAELSWAEAYEPAAILYANTADPGPALSSHWPTGQTSPRYWNSWEQNTANNVAELQGEVAYLQSQNVSSMGFYANANDWQTITGGTSLFASFPSWHAGSGSKHTAQSHCGTTGTTGGPTKYSQYFSGGFDADVRCY